VEELGGVGTGENMIEFHLSEAVIEVRHKMGQSQVAITQGIGFAVTAAVTVTLALAAVCAAQSDRASPLTPNTSLACCLQDEALASGPPLFAAWDFFLHDSQATGLAPGPRAEWGTTVQYVVEEGALLGEYLAAKTMAVGGWLVARAGLV
jgi:hypothetical protein